MNNEETQPLPEWPSVDAQTRRIASVIDMQTFKPGRRHAIAVERDWVDTISQTATTNSNEAPKPFKLGEEVNRVLEILAASRKRAVKIKWQLTKIGPFKWYWVSNPPLFVVKGPYRFAFTAERARKNLPEWF